MADKSSFNKNIYDIPNKNDSLEAVKRTQQSTGIWMGPVNWDLPVPLFINTRIF